MPNPMIAHCGECKKFSPNIFNKTKCANCFKQKEEHSAEALENNRSTRKIAKCGYLFVAPGWDFSNPINRTKRWQRRWFVLYDDGELSYSLDEHPETIPQACIDMNAVINVTEAEELTGNPSSLAITTSDQVHFVKATSREETKWWLDVLSVFPRSKGRQKRTAVNITKPSASVPITSSSPLKSPFSPSKLEYFDLSTNSGLVSSNEKINRIRQIKEKRCLTDYNFSNELTKIVPSWNENKSGTAADDVSHNSIIEEFNVECKMKDVTDSVSCSPSRRSNSPCSFSSFDLESPRDIEITTHKQIRGDPDGCGLDLTPLRYSPSSELRTGKVNEDLQITKKGWLMKQENPPNQGWNKYWFVLRGSSLLYYRDSTCEDHGILDGVVDLNGMNLICETQTARNYGFQIKMWDERHVLLSAVTSGIRSNWISAIKRAVALPEKKISAESNDVPSSRPRSILLSSDDEYRTASENERQSCSEWGETLPPSPPLNRTPISRVKERARGVTKMRLYNGRNSTPSLPTSKHFTIESAKCKSDLLFSPTDAVQSETREKSALVKKLEKQTIELEEIKRQLTKALRQLSNTEEELLRLRQQQTDVTALEKQITETMLSLKRAEDTLKQKNYELSEYESLKKRYAEEKLSWQREIRVAENEVHESEKRYSEICCQLSTSREHIEQLRNELDNVSKRLARGIEENECLYSRVQELENRSLMNATIRDTKTRSLDSLSDLTNIDFDMDFQMCDKERIVEEYKELKARFDKAVQEIRVMKRELRESHIQNDCLEINLINVRQDLKCKQELYESQAYLMAARIQDLTTKLSNAEKLIRLLKQKLSKTETREKRRSLSLKGRESSAICKELEEKLLLLEKRVALLDKENTKRFIQAEDDAKNVSSDFAPPSPQPASSTSTTMPKNHGESNRVASCVRRKSLDSATSTEAMKILIRMNSLEAKVADASRKIVIKRSPPSEGFEEASPAASLDDDSVSNELKNIENLLRNKLHEIYAKEKSMRDAGTLTEQAKMNLTAERLAYEYTLICRWYDVATCSAEIDIADAERLMTELERKLKGERIVTKSPVQYFTASLLQRLDGGEIRVEPYKVDDRTSNANANASTKREETSAVKGLLERWDALAKMIDSFVAEHIEELSNAFVDKSCKELSIDDDRTQCIVDLIWKAINDELVDVEVNQVLLACIDTYAPATQNESASDSLLLSRFSYERWAELVRASFKGYMENALTQLKERYDRRKVEAVGAKERVARSTIDADRVKRCLQQFTDVIAHKCLLDARISIVKEKDSAKSNDREVSKLSETAVAAEVQYALAKMQNDSKLVDREKRICESIESVGSEVTVLLNSVENLVRKRSLSDSISDSIQLSDGTFSLPDSLWDSMELMRGMNDSMNSLCDSRCSQSSGVEGVFRRCSEIKEQIINLQSCLLQNQECQNCSYLQEQLKRKEAEFEALQEQFESTRAQELAATRLEHENERSDLITTHEDEVKRLKKQLDQLGNRMSSLDSEYSLQTDDARFSLFEAPFLESDSEAQTCEGNIRQRYRQEVEQLRNLCEKGLVAMNNSHKRIIAELEEQHRQELECLKIEKDQALAEETRATLSALEAMRKAHEAEVQREILKFKNEHAKKIQSSHDIGMLHKEHETEMEEIKREILSLSEKYSIKCVEFSTLEEELRKSNLQLALAQRRITQLDNSNKILKAHIVSEENDNVQNRNLSLQLQLEEKTDQILNLEEQLSAHDDTLNSLCTHLRNGNLDYTVLNVLLEKLRSNKNSRKDSNAKNLANEKNTINAKNVGSFDQNLESDSRKKKLVNLVRQDLLLYSPVSGIVAERKKIFEPMYKK